MMSHVGRKIFLKKMVTVVFFNLERLLTFVRVLREPKKQTTTKQRTKSSRLW